MRKRTNKIRFKDTYAEIICIRRTGEEVAFKVDIEDVPALSNYNWVVQGNSSKSGIGKYYAIANINTANTHTTIKMHQLLCPTLPHQYVDHINRDTKDNRKINLRSVDARSNALNSTRSYNSVGIRGVYSRHPNKWYAILNTRINGKDKIIQTKQYDSIEKASYARYVLCIKCMPVIPPETDMSWKDKLEPYTQQEIYKDIIQKFSKFLLIK